MLTSHTANNHIERSDGCWKDTRSHSTQQRVFLSLLLWLRGRRRQAALSITHWKTGLGWILLWGTAGRTKFLTLNTHTKNPHFCWESEGDTKTGLERTFLWLHFYDCVWTLWFEKPAREQHVPLKTLILDNGDEKRRLNLWTRPLTVSLCLA